MRPVIYTASLPDFYKNDFLSAMKSYDSRIDAYIAKAAPFAQSILEHARALVHEVCPDVEESLKWGMPSFSYKGILCGMAAFKQHCGFGFWKAAIMDDPQGVMQGREAAAMGSFGKMTSLKDLPSDKVLKALIREAMRLNEAGISVPKAPAPAADKKAEIPEPDDVKAALAQHAAAQEKWAAFAPSHRREYLQWITEAKTEATRSKRLAQMLEWVGEGKGRNWKYQK